MIKTSPLGPLMPHPGRRGHQRNPGISRPSRRPWGQRLPRPFFLTGDHQGRTRKGRSEGCYGRARATGETRSVCLLFFSLFFPFVLVIFRWFFFKEDSCVFSVSEVINIFFIYLLFLYFLFIYSFICLSFLFGGLIWFFLTIFNSWLIRSEKKCY